MVGGFNIVGERFDDVNVTTKRAMPMAYIIDKKGLIESVNSEFVSQLGYTREEMIGKPLLEIVSEVDHPMVKEMVKVFNIKTVKPFHWRLRLLKKDGTPLTTSESISLFKSSDGGLRAFITSIDITEILETKPKINI